jgi:hypothetical protein
MCIISDSIKKVANTKILVINSKDQTGQITVYENRVDTHSMSNAMILPVPHPDTVNFIDLSKYNHIFNQCERDFFDRETTLGIRKGTYSSTNTLSRDSELEVFDVGSYSVSLAKNVGDLERLNGMFNLTSGCKDFISRTYTSKIWGFVVCRLKQGDHTYHPLAYSHRLLNNNYFIPTMHYHDHGSLFGSSLHESDWDHDIYIYNGDTTGMKFAPLSTRRDPLERFKWSGKCSLDSTLLDFAPVKSGTKLNIEGDYKNGDIFIPVM